VNGSPLRSSHSRRIFANTGAARGSSAAGPLNCSWISRTTARGPGSMRSVTTHGVTLRSMACVTFAEK
jgi:hypothetical protein